MVLSGMTVSPFLKRSVTLKAVLAEQEDGIFKKNSLNLFVKKKKQQHIIGFQLSILLEYFDDF